MTPSYLLVHLYSKDQNADFKTYYGVTYPKITKNFVVDFWKLVRIIVLDYIICDNDQLTSDNSLRCNNRLDNIVTNILNYYVNII